jgi:hypothetical protein
MHVVKESTGERYHTVRGFVLVPLQTGGGCGSESVLE